MNLMKMQKKYIAVVAIVLAIGGYYWYSKSHASTVTVRYNTSAAEKGTLTTSVTGSGNIIVDQIANVDPTISGTVANLAVAVGDSVKKGQLLFTIDNEQLGVSVNQATASLQQSANSVDSAKLNVKQAKSDYDIAKKSGSGSTSKQKAILKEKIDIAKDGVTAAEKSYIATKSSYVSQLSDAGKRKVIAPISGTVNAVNIKNGDDLGKVSSGSTRQVPIIVGDLSTLKAYVQVNEVDVPNVSIGQKVTLKFDAIDGLNLTGKVEKMDSLGTISQGVVTYNVTIGLDMLDARIKPEMSVSAAIITDVKQDVLIVPSSAVKTQGSRTYVEVLSGLTPEQKTVEVGASNGTDTEIMSGINVGDKVVTQTINSNTTSTPASSSGFRGGIGIPGLGGRG